jgi:hypothetical protein
LFIESFIEQQRRENYLKDKDLVQREGIEIFDGVFVGGRLSAMNFDTLKERSVTGIVNVTTEVRCYFESESAFEYLKIAVDDAIDEPLINYFDQTSTFIEEHLNKGGKVHVHCKMGQSRSCSVIVACKFQLPFLANFLPLQLRRGF